MHMLTAKEMQNRLQVDRSTIYRMAEAGRLPAIKVGKQWRFPAQQVDVWLGQAAADTGQPTPLTFSPEATEPTLAEVLPIECVQLVQDTFADLLGVTLMITDMDGRPITKISHPCGLFELIRHSEQAWQRCSETWAELAHTLDLEPQLTTSHLGLYCMRALIRVGSELKGMVVAGMMAPEQWPPSAAEIKRLAAGSGLDPAELSKHIHEVCYLAAPQRAQVRQFMQRIATIIAHMVDERQKVVQRLSAIAELTAL